MLWEKCPNDEELYVELWPMERRTFSDSTRILHKNNQNARDFRAIGNLQFHSNNIEQARIFYNISLCLAEHGSEEQAMAYANRSMCFLRLKLFSNCLVDIQLAKEANYPENLLAKLEKRASHCKKMLKTIQKKQEPQLSFSNNTKIPGMADCLRIEKDDKYSTRVITTRDLQIGQNILIETPCIQHMSDGSGRRCYNCYKEYANLMPCKKCVKGMFCSQTCMDNSCEVNESEICIDECLTETFRSILLALEAYPNIQNLIAATEEIRLRSHLWDEVQDYLESPSPKTTYRLFFSRGVNNAYLLKEFTEENKQNQLVAYHQVMKNPKMAKIFSSIASQRFLMHLILHHVLVIKGFKGIFALYEDQVKPPGTLMADKYSQLYAVGHYPIGNMFNHSCVPNVFLVTFDHRIVMKIVQPVKSGEELFVPYFTISKRTDPLKDRRAQLYQLGWQLPEHQCKCYLCLHDDALDRKLPNMSIVDKLTNILFMTKENVTQSEASDFIKDATKYLNKYNSNHPSFNTLTAQDGLYLFWHLFPDLV